MDERKMEIISQLMEELESMMEPNEDDLCERLGKPKVAVAIEAKEEPGEEMEIGMEDGEDEDLKRLMKVRGV